MKFLMPPQKSNSCSQHLETKYIQMFKLLILFLMISSFAFAQTTVTGKVTTGDTALSGVSVQVKGASTATQTDANGQFSIDALSNGTLVFSFVGYATQEVPVGNRTSINVQLQSRGEQMGEVVVVGYGTQRKQDLTGAVAVVDARNLEKRNQPSVGQALQGMAPGVRVTGSNMPGQNPRIEIRGVGTINNSSPLYIVDGMYMDDISNIAPGDIANMQILKDASSAAIYGSRAANGVIVITTKKGRAGDKLNVNFDAFYGVQNIYQRLDVMNREEYQALMRAATTADGLPVDAANNPQHPEFVSNINTDWQREAFQPGPFDKYSIALSGGSAVSRFRISADYNHRKSMVVGQGPDFKRYNVSINTDQSYKKFKFGQSILLSKTQGLPFNSTHAYSAVINVLKSLPTIPVHDPGVPGGFAGTESKHNVINLNMVGWNSLIKQQNNNNYILAGVNGEYEILNGLFVRSTASYSYRAANNNVFTPIYRIGYFFSNTIANLSETRWESTQKTANAVLNYKKVFGSHTVDAMVGGEYFQEDFDQLVATAQGYNPPYARVIDAGPNNRSSSGFKRSMAQASSFARLNYNYSDKYLLTASMRRDANSRFAEKNRVGYFPSVAVGWNLHNESFLQLPDFISALKLRSSYGELGNSSMGDYLYQRVLNVQAGYIIGGNYQPGSTVTDLVNDEVVWEATKSFNAGLDLGLLNGALTLSAEFYRNTTSDILFAVDIPYSTGSATNPTINSASMRNSGFEAAVTFQRSPSADFNYSFSGNISTVKNVVTKIGTGIPIYGSNTITRVGESISQLFGYKVDRLFQSAEEISKSPLQQNAKPGDIKFMDLDGNNVIDQNDRTVLGKSVPDFTYGFGANFGYKNFDLYAQFYGVNGNSIFNQSKQVLERGGRERENQLKTQSNFWTPANTNTNIPRASVLDLNNNGRGSDRYVDNGSYLRMTDLQLGYRFRQIKRLNNLRVYGSIQNVFVITDYTGLDPEVDFGGPFTRGFDSGSFPMPRTFMMGVQLAF